MQTDRELLELAAKAAGIQVAAWYPDGRARIETGRLNGHNPEYFIWNPLTDDGDALRLAVKLGITIDTPIGGKWVYAGGNSSHSESSAPDVFAATCRAIVRAAAEIGKASDEH